MAAYSTDDTKQPIEDSIGALDSEIRSLRAVWPNTPIILVGHSYGGLVAEEWWSEAWAAGDHLGVTHVFSLDSPINGVDHCLLAAAAQGVNVSTEFCRLRDSLTEDRSVDSNIISLAEDRSYTAVGNVDDPTYTGVLSAGGGLEDQVIYQCQPGGDTSTSCVASPPSLVINADENDKTCKEGSSQLYGTTGHDIVKACPVVVDAIVAAVKDAKAITSPPTTTTTPTPPAPPGVQAELAVVAHWLDLLHTKQSSRIVKDFGQIKGAQGLTTSLIAGSGMTPAQVIDAATNGPGHQPSFEFHFVYVAPELVKDAPNLPLGQGVTKATVTGDMSLRVVAVDASGTSLTPADVANGMTFRGSVSVQMVNRWRADPAHTYSPFTDYTFWSDITLQNGHASLRPVNYDGKWLGAEFWGMEYPADIPFSVACQLGETGALDYVDSNGKPPSGC